MKRPNVIYEYLNIFPTFPVEQNIKKLRDEAHRQSTACAAAASGSLSSTDGGGRCGFFIKIIKIIF
jgi:hypothetical protein